MSNQRISCSNLRERGIRICFSRVSDRDGVKRWESEEGYEMFRFNVPGKSGKLLFSDSVQAEVRDVGGFSTSLPRRQFSTM